MLRAILQEKVISYWVSLRKVWQKVCPKKLLRLLSSSLSLLCLWHSLLA